MKNPFDCIDCEKTTGPDERVVNTKGEVRCGSCNMRHENRLARVRDAAPELLEACENVLEALESYQRVLRGLNNQPFAIADWVLDLLRKPIAKAKGK